MNNPRNPAPDTSGKITLSVHLPSDWNPVRALGAVCDLSSDYARACEKVCPAQQEARFRDLSLRLVTEAMRINELLTRQRAAIENVRAALDDISAALAPAAPSPQRLVPGQYYSLPDRLQAASAAAADKRSAPDDYLLAQQAISAARGYLNTDCLP